MKVSIKDFQIIKNAELEFVPGLTVIQGESNNGKSAIFRAIKSCIYNEPGNNHVRNGCKNYMVGIQYNGHTIILQKGENSLYVIDGQQYNKIGKTQVPYVAELLGINALSINDTTEKINFWDQMEKPFLLDRNSSELFKFIVDSGKDDNLNNTLRSMVSDKNKLNVEKNLKEGAINQLKKQIDDSEILLAGFEDKIKLCEGIIEFGPLVSNLQTITNTINNINNNNNIITTTTNRINDITEKKKEIDDISSRLSYNISSKGILHDLLDKITTRHTELKTIDNILMNKVDYKSRLDDMYKSISIVEKLKHIVTNMLSLNDVIKVTTDRIPVTLTQDYLTRYSSLSTLLQRITTVNATQSNISAALVSIKQDLEPLLHEYSEIDVCPYCGNKLNHNED